MDFENKLYVNENLSPEFSKLAYNCRLLKRNERIEDHWFKNGHLKVKSRSGEIKVIGHETDLFKIAPDFENFSFVTTDYARIMSDDADFERYENIDGHA